MSASDDLRGMIRQEEALVFERFDEAAAFAVGTRLRERALGEGMPIVIDIQLWDRPLFYAALPGSTGANTHWARRKRNVVRLYHKSSYRMAHEMPRPDKTFPPGEGLDIADYVLAGGGFPIRVGGLGVIGAVAVSGLPSRQDHEVVVATLAEHLGLDGAALALPPLIVDP